MDLAQWRRHIDAVVRDEGQWVGILDEEGMPILDVPSIIRVTAPEARLATSSVEVAVSVHDGAGLRLMEELIADGLGRVDAEKRLIPASGPARLLCVVRPGERLVYTVTHSVASGGLSPSEVTIHGVDLVDSLAWWPCPSIPATWAAADFAAWTTDASGTQYRWPRRLALVEFATAADGYTVKGPARDTIRHLIQDSFDAVNTAMGWDTPHAVVDFSGGTDTSPETIIRTDDSPIFDTIAEPAKQAGIAIEVDLWWPGDPAITIRTTDRTTTEATTWPYPIQIVRVTAPGGEA